MTIPEPHSSKSSDLVKLEQHLITRIAEELESQQPIYRDRTAFVHNTMEAVYKTLKLNLPETIQKQVFRDVIDQVLGYGPLQPLLDDPSISEVMVNGPKSVYVEQKGLLIKTGVQFEDDQAVMRIIEKIIVPLGRRIDFDNPSVDARLPDGSRVNAIIPPVAIDGPTITIRKFDKGRLSIDQLIEYGSITQIMADLVRACVISKLNVLISGGTGSGKTTLLKCAFRFYPIK